MRLFEADADIDCRKTDIREHDERRVGGRLTVPDDHGGGRGERDHRQQRESRAESTHPCILAAAAFTLRHLDHGQDTFS